MKALIFFFVSVGLIVAFSVWAKLEDITYPVVELGNCESQEACFAYCDEPTNYNVCIAFAETNKLLEEGEIEKYYAIQETLAQGGPGGCASDAECKMYCDDINHMRECITFADEHGLMGEKELGDAQKVLNALDAGYSMPGGCTGKDDCDIYCSQPEYMEECFNFAEAAGFMSEEEISKVRTVMTLMQNGESPGGCLNQNECDAYCGDQTHFEECLDFAEAAGFMSEEEAENIRATGGAGPGDCRSDEECKAYCEDETHREECNTFAIQTGLMSEEEAEMIEQMAMDEFVGPGGCSNENACRSYCDDKTNEEECLSFFGGKKDEEIKDFVDPGDCTNEEECMQFFGDENEWEENKEFQGEYENFIVPEDCAEGTECASFFNEPMDVRENNREYEKYRNEDAYRSNEFNGEKNQLDYPDDNQIDAEGFLWSDLEEWEKYDDPNYQTEYEYEGNEQNELNNEYLREEYKQWGEYESNEFEKFDSGDSSIDFYQEGNSIIPYEEIYIQPENMNTSPYNDGGGVLQNEGGTQGGEGGGEPLSVSGSGFIHTVKQLFGGVLTKTLKLMSI